jgi:hypothetical protein
MLNAISIFDKYNYLYTHMLDRSMTSIKASRHFDFTPRNMDVVQIFTSGYHFFPLAEDPEVKKVRHEKLSKILKEISQQFKPSAKLFSLAQIVANDTKKHSPYRVTARGLKFQLINDFFKNEIDRVVFFCGLLSQYEDTFVFEKDYKSADHQLFLLGVTNPTVLKYQDNKSNFSEGQQTQISQYIDIWTELIFEESSDNDPEVKSEILDFNYIQDPSYINQCKLRKHQSSYEFAACKLI